MSKEPKDLEWFPCYVNRWQNSEAVIEMSLAARGAYWELLCHQFRNGDLPSSQRSLAKMIGCTLDELAAVWPELEECFILVENRLVNKDMAQIRCEQLAKLQRLSQAGAKGMAKRWGTEPETPAVITPLDSTDNTAITPLSKSGNDDITIRLEKIREEKNEKREITTPEEGGKESNRKWAKNLFDGLPATHRTPAIAEALKLYAKLRTDKGWGALVPVTVDLRIKTFSEHTPDECETALLASVENSWQKLVFREAQRPSAGKPAPLSMTETFEAAKALAEGR